MSTKKATATKKTAKSKPTVDSQAFANATVNKKLTKEQKLDMYSQMVRIRRFEERSLRAYQQGKIGGFLHLYIGQEAVAVGSISVCGENDHVITAYRDHGHALVSGMNMKECMAELFGKATGCSKGKGGSMHYFAPDKNYWGGHGIVGGQIPLGTGIAYALKYKGLKGACLAYMGDGAVNQGAVHEAYNLAALWDIPVVFIIENNGYSMGTSLARSSAYQECLAKRAEGYDMAWDTCNGNLLYEVRAKISECLERAHKESKPTLLEIFTYRYRGHSVADANHEKYRTKEEIEDYKKNKDPITLWEKVLLDEGVATAEDFKKIDTEAKAEADEAARFADESPFPKEEDITADVYWEADNPEKRTSQGRLFFND